jgi:hypothetical protein
LREEQNQIEEELNVLKDENSDLQIKMYNMQQDYENELQIQINNLDIKDQTIQECKNQLEE